jgi:hypothetical protein
LDEGDAMKCIHCGRISRRRERVDGRCPGCGHAFAFDPGVRPGAGTDAEFQVVIDRVSGGGRLRFTTRQLWLAATLPRVMPAPPHHTALYMLPFALLLGVPMFAIAAVTGMPAMMLMPFVGTAAGAAIGWAMAQDEIRKHEDRLRPFPIEPFLRYQLAPWLQVHGEIPGLLPPRDADAAAAQVPADAATGEVDRVVVTDRWETAQMLVANGFHLQHRCAVLSRDGYPDGVADAVRQALRRNPRLTVFALHDASPDGCRLPLDLRGPEWFPDPSVRVVDLGLRPATVMRLNLPPLPGERVPSLTAGLYELLPYRDRHWLDGGNSYELAAVPSAHLMRAVYEGMVAAGRDDGSGRAPAYNDAFWSCVGLWFGSMAGGGTDTTADLAAVAMSR